MLFTSHSFIFLFLPAALIACYTATRFFKRSGVILSVIAISIAFYFLTNHSQLAVLIVSLVGNYLLIRLWFATESSATRHTIIAVSVVANLTGLAYYKYAAFLVSQFNLLFGGDLTLAKISLPLGISFFTFQQIAYALDVHFGRVKEHRLLDYAFCVTFFPHLVAGPIVNYRELIPQLRAQKIFGFRQIDLIVGLSVFLIGLIKKVLIADMLATYVAPGFSSAEAGGELSLVGAWVSALAYSLQIYFDFSGYSDMAIGLARLFGVHLPVNFASPYKATGIIDFWRRWHITLSRFLRDYLYVPLGGNRHGSLRRYLNLMITMLLGGLWHGASWTFVVWGGAHGLLLTINHAWRAIAGRLGLSWLLAGPVGLTLARGLTFVVVVLTWVLFRAETISGASAMFKAMFALNGLPAMSALSWADWHLWILLPAAAVIAFAAPNTQEFMSRYRVAIRPEGKDLFEKPAITWRASMPWLLLTAAVGGVACFYQADFPPFLYWGF